MARQVPESWERKPVEARTAADVASAKAVSWRQQYEHLIANCPRTAAEHQGDRQSTDPPCQLP